MSIKFIEKIRTKALASASVQEHEVRGDTFIEVMFAIATFALVAVISVAMMDAGVAAGERSLEAVTVRNEINAQAEAIRFIHTSYVAELSLPNCDPANTSEECQRPFTRLWDKIVGRGEGVEVNFNDVHTCKEVYEGPASKIPNSFVVNIRKLGDVRGKDYGAAVLNEVIVGYNDTIFQEPTISARLLYSTPVPSAGSANSAENLNERPSDYVNLVKSEGIWVIRKKGTGYNDFYIQSCWYAPGDLHPSTLDSVVRIYDPGDVL